MVLTRLEDLCRANNKLRDILEVLRSEASARELANAISELSRSISGPERVSTPDYETPELETQICEYREIIRQLGRILPCVEANLLAEKVRLEAERAHLAVAANWLQASKQIL
jgi:hypothetical protein